MVETRALTAPVHTRRVAAGPDGQPVVTDGPYAESQEVLAGYWIVDCESFDRATAIAAKLGQCPAPESVAATAVADVRPIMESQDEITPLSEVDDAGDRPPRTCCAAWRRRSSVRSSGATVTSTWRRTPCRRRCSPRATQWPTGGRPDQPKNWLITVASRRLTDLLRADQARQQRENVAASRSLPDDWLAPAADRSGSADDDSLILLFLCCHPSLSPASQIALDPSGGGRAHDRGDRPRLPGARGHDDPADQPGQTVDQEQRSAVPAAAARRTRDAAVRSCMCSI